MNVDIFLDTNILVYAHDRDAGEKHVKAKALIDGFWTHRQTPWLSIQILQELHVNLVRKGTDIERSAQIVSRYFSWRVIDNTRQLLQQAFTIQPRWQISFWDSLVVAAAQRANVAELWSEDLNDGQDYDGVRVLNPLKST